MKVSIEHLLETETSYLLGCRLEHSSLIQILEVFDGVDILDLSLGPDMVDWDAATMLDGWA